MSTIFGQEVSISQEMNVRNYFSYELIGEIDDRIILYRDKGFTKEVDVFNLEMEHTQSSELNFEKKKTDVFTVVGLDSVFQVLYGYMEKDSMVFKMRVYDKLVRLIDSTTLTKVYKKKIKKRISHHLSPDKTKVLLSTKNGDDDILFYLYDYKRKKIIWNSTVFIEKKISSIFLTDHGKIILRERDENKSGTQIILHIVDPSNPGPQSVIVDLQEAFYKNVLIDYDNKHQQLIVCGNFGEKKDKDSKGVFILKKSLLELQGFEYPQLINYDPNLGRELIQGKKKNKKRILDDLYVKEIILRNDGGLLLVSEITKEFSRRSPYNSAYGRSAGGNPYSRRGWIDYYNEDIVITNVDNSGNVVWNKVLYKKQFSQDDDAIFSSFFIMKTPSRLRIIYNDEIKNSSTVSEYLMDPVGRIARNSLLSTEYQNMKLRFKDAVQLSSNTLLIPSEKNYDLNLVKITY